MAKRDGRLRLGHSQVFAIRKTRAEGWSILRIAQRFGVGKTTIQDILEGKTWRRAIAPTPLPPSASQALRRVRLLDVLLVLMDNEPVALGGLARTLRAIDRGLRHLAVAGIAIPQNRDRFVLVGQPLFRAKGKERPDAPFELRTS